MTLALLVVDAQNEFSSAGLRPVPNHGDALEVIAAHVARARASGTPIAWIQHHNKPSESPAFLPGSWGAELSPGLGPRHGTGTERLFQKEVFGAFSGTDLEGWLQARGIEQVLITGFYTHMCVSTSAREALVRGLDVSVDASGTGACALEDGALGRQSADDVRRTALLQLSHMGVSVLNGAHLSALAV